MTDVLWLRPKGEALAAYEAYRASWIRNFEAKNAFAIARGAAGFLSNFDGELYGLFFKKEPENVPAAYKHSPRNPHRRHAYVLRSSHLKAYREAVAAEKALIAQMPLPDNLGRIATSLGLPLSYRYESGGEDGVRGCAKITCGTWDSWEPVWENATGPIFIKGADIRLIRAGYPDHVVTFDVGDGDIPENAFDIVQNYEAKLEMDRDRASQEHQAA